MRRDLYAEIHAALQQAHAEGKRHQFDCLWQVAEKHCDDRQMEELKGEFGEWLVEAAA